MGMRKMLKALILSRLSIFKRASASQGAFFVFFFCLINTPAYSAEPPLAVVESSYKDEATGKKLAIKGTGFLIEVPGWFGKSTYYLATASHVSQGEDTKVIVDDKEVKILLRSANNNHDLELMEVDVPEGTKAPFFMRKKQAHL